MLSYIEASIPRYYHATSAILKSLDRIQGRFLRDIGVSEIDVLFKFNLIVLSVRSDITMLGLLHIGLLWLRLLLDCQHYFLLKIVHNRRTYLRDYLYIVIHFSSLDHAFERIFFNAIFLNWSLLIIYYLTILLIVGQSHAFNSVRI